MYTEDIPEPSSRHQCQGSFFVPYHGCYHHHSCHRSGELSPLCLCYLSQQITSPVFVSHCTASYLPCFVSTYSANLCHLSQFTSPTFGVTFHYIIHPPFSVTLNNILHSLCFCHHSQQIMSTVFCVTLHNKFLPLFDVTLDNK